MKEMKAKIFKIKRTCAICCCEYEDVVIDHHVSYPNVCGWCIQRLLSESKFYCKEEE